MIGVQSSGGFAPLAAIRSNIGLTDAGLLWGDQVRLMRMSTNGSGRTSLALDDTRRFLTLVTVATGRPVEPTMLVHIEAAANLWEGGDKALANLRLVFAGLPRLDDSAAVERLRLAECLLDEGMTPAQLAQELDLDVERSDFEKYWEDQPRVPAGHGRESGRWTDTIDVAMVDGPPEYEEERKAEHFLPHGRPHVTESGRRIFDPSDGLLTGAGPGNGFVAKALGAAVKAKENVGPGRGPVYGTTVHTEFKRIIGDLKDPAMHPEQSYKDGVPVDYGTPGSIRLDCVAGSIYEPTHFVDMKTGVSRWTPARERLIRSHLPRKCTNIPAYVVRP